MAQGPPLGSRIHCPHPNSGSTPCAPVSCAMETGNSDKNPRISFHMYENNCACVCVTEVDPRKAMDTGLSHCPDWNSLVFTHKCSAILSTVVPAKFNVFYRHFTSNYAVFLMTVPFMCRNVEGFQRKNEQRLLHSQPISPSL